MNSDTQVYGPKTSAISLGKNCRVGGTLEFSIHTFLRELLIASSNRACFNTEAQKARYKLVTLKKIDTSPHRHSSAR